MLVRFFIAIGSGLLVGGVLYEGLLAGHELLFPEHRLIESLMRDPSFSVGKALILIGYWTLGTSASALMAAGLAGTRWAGALAAACWVIPLALLIGLSSQPGIRLSLAFSIAILAGLLCLRVNASEAARSTT